MFFHQMHKHIWLTDILTLQHLAQRQLDNRHLVWPTKCWVNTTIVNKTLSIVYESTKCQSASWFLTQCRSAKWFSTKLCENNLIFCNKKFKSRRYWRLNTNENSDIVILIILYCISLRQELFGRRSWCFTIGQIWYRFRIAHLVHLMDIYRVNMCTLLISSFIQAKRLRHILLLLKISMLSL